MHQASIKSNGKQIKLKWVSVGFMASTGVKCSEKIDFDKAFDMVDVQHPVRHPTQVHTMQGWEYPVLIPNSSL